MTDPNFVIVETVSLIRTRYLVQLDHSVPYSHAKVLVDKGVVPNMSSKAIDEVTVTHRMLSREETVQMIRHEKPDFADLSDELLIRLFAKDFTKES